MALSTQQRALTHVPEEQERIPKMRVDIHEVLY